MSLYMGLWRTDVNLTENAEGFQVDLGSCSSGGGVVLVEFKRV